MRAIYITACLFAFTLGACNSTKRANDEASIAARVQFHSELAQCDSNRSTNAAYAECVNAAENKYIRPIYPFPDLLDLRLASRLNTYKRVDSGVITPEQGSLELAEANARIASEESRRFTSMQSVRAQQAMAVAASRPQTVVVNNQPAWSNPFIPTFQVPQSNSITCRSQRVPGVGSPVRTTCQ